MLTTGYGPQPWLQDLTGEVVHMSSALEPIEQREVMFYEDEVTAVLVPSDEGEQVLIPVRPLCERLGLSWPGQLERINRDPVLSEIVMSVRVTRTDIDPSSRQPRTSEMLCLPLDFLNGWLFGVSANRVKDEIRERLIRYQKDCYRVLAAAFQQTAVSPTMANLAQIRGLALAIAQMAEEQMEHERRISTAENRLNQAAVIVGGIDKRLKEVEARVSPGQPITNEQASEIKELVKAVAMSQGGKPENFQAIWGEMYRRFGVGSYKLIPQRKYADVLAFLEEWRGRSMS